MADTLVELIQEGKDITATLTDSEKVRLEACEQVIRKGFDTFLDVGQALADIHDNRLYRETHDTFEKYCKGVWDFSRMHAHRQINGYRAVNLLESKCNQLVTNSETPPKETTPANQEIILPINEAQTRPLTKLKNPDDQVRAWGIVLQQLNENPKAKLTAALISRAVKEVRGDVAKRKIDTAKKAVDATSLLSRQFKIQYQVMMDIIDAEKNNEWVTSKRKEVIKWLSTLVKIAESDD